MYFTEEHRSNKHHMRKKKSVKGMWGRPNEIAVVMHRCCKLKWTTIANVSYEVHSWWPCALLVGVQINRTPLKYMLATPIQFKHMHTQSIIKDMPRSWKQWWWYLPHGCTSTSRFPFCEWFLPQGRLSISDFSVSWLGQSLILGYFPIL